MLVHRGHRLQRVDEGHGQARRKTHGVLKCDESDRERPMNLIHRRNATLPLKQFNTEGDISCIAMRSANILALQTTKHVEDASTRSISSVLHVALLCKHSTDGCDAPASVELSHLPAAAAQGLGPPRTATSTPRRCRCKTAFSQTAQRHHLTGRWAPAAPAADTMLS